MLDPVFALFRSLWAGIRRVCGLVVAALVWPFMAVHGWYRDRGLLHKAIVAAILAIVLIFYGAFVWQTQRWTGFDPDFIAKYELAARPAIAGQEIPSTTGARVCQTSAIVDVTADLIDFNVNQNGWVSSMLAYRIGLFGVDWDHTPFFDNKASFQRGVNQAIRRTAVELVDSLGRVRGTSGVNQDLQNARGNMQFDEYSWYFGLDPFGPKTPTPSYYRAAESSLRKFNASLENCSSTFDTRADNFVQFIDRIANDIGSTSAILAERAEFHNRGWFDFRADDRFWFAYGQLYGYYGVLSAAGADFSQVVRERNLTQLWSDTLTQTRAALNIQPWIISNGREDGIIMPSHLSTMGFRILRLRSNLVELRSVLDR
ncbi:DUF2333 family protein [Rhizobiaceae bacterium BDR2-2]|uniref:DUF2333 family protein n=1 Tax=Ectorhizobium quercum TaxID=2965071 RepID=A0AAE3MY61_9HYPH|nr:DUF2333 family protein [Ectorhizobium quercum]MCX8996621.1 DUF2333 family protein [Ectorhizobium quercum]